MFKDTLCAPRYRELIVDNFAGGGGASTGISIALGRDPDIAVNHDREALAMHEANHPGTAHYCEDVFAVDPLQVTGGQPVGLCWLSPDCKHFSKAKGGKPKSKKIRGLAWVAIKWAATARPRVIVLENVEEFQDWGPLLPGGSPCPVRKGNTFRNFTSRLKNLGYKVEWRQLRACDYGAPTIRRRLFLIARRDYRPIVWPVPTHADPRKMNSRKEAGTRRDQNPRRLGASAGELKPWRTAAECIDWSIPCPCIFERKKPLAEATLRRIARGIRKFVIESPNPFIVPLTHGGGGNRSYPIADPLHTVTGAHRGELAIVAPSIARVAHGEESPGGVKRRGDGAHPVDAPLGTVPASGEFALVETGLAPILTEHANSSKQRVFAADQPLRTQCGDRPAEPCEAGNHTPEADSCGEDGARPQLKGGHFAAVTAKVAHVTKFRTGSTGTDLNEPLHNITAGPKENPAGAPHALGLVAATLVQTGYGEREGQQPRAPGIDKPLGTVMGGGQKHAAVAAFLAKHYGDQGQRPGSAMDEPTGTVTSVDHNAVVAATLVGCGGRMGQSPEKSPESPANTITAKADTCLVAATLVGAGGPEYSGKPRAVDTPAHSQTAENHTAVAVSHLSKLYGTTTGHSPDEPIHTVTGSAHIAEVRAFLIKYYGNEKDGARLGDPIHTVTGNDRLGLVTIHGQDYVITDIGMRMLSPRELFNAQGFPPGYIIDLIAPDKRGRRRPLPKTSQVRMCGNSVCPPVAAAIVGANYQALSAADLEPAIPFKPAPKSRKQQTLRAAMVA